MARLPLILFVLALMLGFTPDCRAVQEVPKEELPINDPGLYQAWMSAGRKSFQERKYSDAWMQYRKALEMRPTDAYTRMVTGVAAYWSREPEAALEYYNALLKTPGVKGVSEKDITMQRILALSALQRDKEVDPLIKQLEELRAAELLAGGKVAEGFTREHNYQGSLRAGIWQRFPAQDGVKSYQISVVDTKGAQDQQLVKLNIEPEKGGPRESWWLADDTGRRVFRRWPLQPSYDEVRSTVKALLEGKLQPQLNTAAGIEPGGAAPVKPGTSPAVDRILAKAEALAPVDFDMTRSVRFSITDVEKAKRMEEKELQERYPEAPNNAAELVRYVARASAEDYANAFEKLTPVLEKSKSGYLRFALLTGLSARGGEMPRTFILDCLGQRDFMVRQTAALVWAKSGQRDGLETLFKELKEADVVSARLLSFSLEEVIGPQLGACPAATEERALAKWRDNALDWWKANAAKMNFYTARGALQPPWRENP